MHVIHIWSTMTAEKHSLLCHTNASITTFPFILLLGGAADGLLKSALAVWSLNTKLFSKRPMVDAMLQNAHVSTLTRKVVVELQPPPRRDHRSLQWRPHGPKAPPPRLPRTRRGHRFRQGDGPVSQLQLCSVCRASLRERTANRRSEAEEQKISGRHAYATVEKKQAGRHM